MAAELFQEVHQVALCRGKGPEQRDAGRRASGERRGEVGGGRPLQPRWPSGHQGGRLPRALSDSQVASEHLQEQLHSFSLQNF